LNCMFPSMTFSEKLEDLKMLNLPAEKWVVSWHQRLWKYAKSYEQEIYYNAELLCEEADAIFKIHIKKQKN
jgi:hypothetical protein